MSDVTQRKTAAGDAAAQQAQIERRGRHDAAAAQFLHSGGRSIDRGETPFRGSDDEGYSDQRSNQAEQRHALIVKGVGEGLPGYSEHDYADEDGQRQ